MEAPLPRFSRRTPSASAKPPAPLPAPVHDPPQPPPSKRPRLSARGVPPASASGRPSSALLQRIRDSLQVCLGAPSGPRLRPLPRPRQRPSGHAVLTLSRTLLPIRPSMRFRSTRPVCAILPSVAPRAPAQPSVPACVPLAPLHVANPRRSLPPRSTMREGAHAPSSLHQVLPVQQPPVGEPRAHRASQMITARAAPRHARRAGISR